MVDYGFGMGDINLVDPRYQEPLRPGWWKTGAGWLALLRSNRVDRRAKPVVIVLIVIVFLLVNWVTNRQIWGPLAALSGILVAVVLIYSPIDSAKAAPRQPLQPGWWKTRDGWSGLPHAGFDEPGVGVFRLVTGLVIAAGIVAWRGWRGVPLAVLFVPSLGRGVLPERFRPYVRPVSLVGFFVASALWWR